MIREKQSVFFGELRATPAQIVQMAEIYGPEHIAALSGRDLDEVLAVLAEAGKTKAKRIVARDHRTGRTITGYTPRGLYLKAQLRGWGNLGADWDIVGPEAAA